MYERLVEDAVDVIWSSDIDGRFTYLSRQFHTLFGFDPVECIGARNLDFVHPDDHEYLVEAVKNLLKGRASKNKEFRHRCFDGSYIWVMVKASLVRSNDYQVIGLQGIIRDISDRKETELALRDSQEQFRKITENVPGIIYRFVQRVDGSAALLFIGPQCREYYEVGPQEALEDVETFYQFYHPEDLERLKKARDRSARELSEFQVEYRVLLPRKGLRWYRSIGQPSLVENGDIVWDGIVTDITDSKQFEFALQNANKQLAEATRMKDQFFANMSHELRTPLTTILGLSEGLQQGVFGQMTDDQAESLVAIQESGEHLLALISDVLDLAKIESGSLDLEISSVDIGRLCESSLQIISQQAQSKNIELHLKLPSNLSQLKTDEKLMRQVLVNLLSNAVKFTGNGGAVSLMVEIVNSNAGAEELLRFSVRDNGIGIDNSLIPTLFDPFVQAQTSLNSDHGGTGLGLALVKQCAELCSGSVSVDSEPGVGSSFHVDLPYRQYTSDKFMQVAKYQHGSTNPIKTRVRIQNKNNATTSILLAEDNDAVAKTMKRFLEFSGYPVHRVSDGQAAIKAAEEQLPTVILMDVQMPGVDGLSAMKQIRKNKKLKNTQIIALTGLAMEGDRKRCLEAGADHYLSKPFRMQSIIETIEQSITRA